MAKHDARVEQAMTEPRLPTNWEYLTLCEAHAKFMHNTENINIMENSMVGSYIAVYDSYMPDGPSLAGKIAVCVHGECCFVSLYHWDSDNDVWVWQPLQVD